MIKSRQSGFSLLEAIVAMAIIAGFGMSIFAWTNTNLNTLNKIEKKYKRDQIKRTVVEYMQDINIMQENNGTGELGHYQITWQADLIEPVKDGTNRIGGKSEFEVGLYLTSVSVHYQEKQVADLSMRLVGYRKVRNSMLDGI